MLSNPSVFRQNYFLVIFTPTLGEEAQSVKIRIIASLSYVTTPVPVACAVLVTMLSMIINI